MSALARPLDLAQVFNFRDLGGHATIDGRTIRHRALFRADGLHRLVPDDAPTMAEIGLRTVVDLRTHDEIDKWGHAPVDQVAPDAVVHHLPLLRELWSGEEIEVADSAEDYLVARYLEMLDDTPATIAATFELAADSGAHALVFHCAAGKDRTGVVAALLLALLGVDDHTIAADYHRSAEAVERFEQWLRTSDPDAADTMSSHPPAFRACPEEAMLRFLEAIEGRSGSVESYVRDIGVGADVIAELRGQLVV